MRTFPGASAPFDSTRGAACPLKDLRGMYVNADSPARNASVGAARELQSITSCRSVIRNCHSISHVDAQRLLLHHLLPRQGIEA